MSGKTTRVRNAEQVVAALVRTNLPEATLTSGGIPASEWEVPPAGPFTSHTADGYRGGLVKAGAAHPYLPSEVDDWLRGRL